MDFRRRCSNRAGAGKVPLLLASKEIVMPSAKKPAPAREAVPAKQAATTAKAAPAVRKAAAGPTKGTAAGVPVTQKPAPGKTKTAAPAKAMAPVKAAPPVIITLKQIAAELADGHGLPKKQAEEVLADLVAATMRHLKNGDKIRLTGVGILQVQARPARMGRNPATGEAVEIKASRKIAFRAAKELKALV
jgi:DNA-binding protein HU-beta